MYVIHHKKKETLQGRIPENLNGKNNCSTTSSPYIPSTRNYQLVIEHFDGATLGAILMYIEPKDKLQY
jgi:hypothetical protein